MPDFSHEQDLGAGLRVAGIDEAGRGPWAGPVVAAAVVFDPTALDPALLQELDDSKKLSPAKRDALHGLILQQGEVGVGTASVAEIDAINILQASLLAMRRAVAALPRPPDAALVDGRQTPGLDIPARALVKGDSLSLSIAAASIVAKVTRDRLMAGLAAQHPGYGWERNQGYGTPEHQAGLTARGVTDQHRRSFRPIRDRLAREPDRLISKRYET